MKNLLEAKFIKEIQYLEWLTNSVTVPKLNGKWRICIDFTDLNDTCPKDWFSLPRIAICIDVPVGHELLSFMDAFSGYNQIKMDEVDIQKVSFITDQGLSCYIVMLFGLKNASITYQSLINRIFKHLIGKNKEVYVDACWSKASRRIIM